MYQSPEFLTTAFNCPICGAYSKQIWASVTLNNQEEKYHAYMGNTMFSVCSHCNNQSIWVERRMVYPHSATAPLPNEDMPEDIKADYEEARNILNLSPRGSVAILRLVIQKLCKHLGEKGENINIDIGNLVKKGLPEKLQKALDSVRVVGNNAVHPGQLDLRDDIETANKIFAFVNVICDNQISQSRIINAFYDEKLTTNNKEAIDKRDRK